MADKNESYERKDYGWLVAMSFVFFVLVAIACGASSAPNGKAFQHDFRNCSGIGKGRIAHFQAGDPADLDSEDRRDDRCITCHLGYDWASVLPATIGEPLMPHPMNFAG